MKTQPPTSAAPGAARDPGVDSTWIASSPAEMIGRPEPTLAPSRPGAPGNLSTSSGGPRSGEEMYETLERPLSAEPSIALERTRPSHPSPAVAVLSPAPPKIGRFTILRTLGEGGMGVVYAAYDEELDRKVAIKVMRDTSQGTDARERMKREAQAMARLSHPNVVQVYDVGDHHGQIYVAMEFVKGADLRAWLGEQPRTWQAIRDMYVQAGRGLAAAHAEGIVHRDFKPDNVLVGADERARVADFGLAGGGGGQQADVLDSTALRVGGRNSAFSTSLTMVGTIMGTPAYMSPEQHSGSPTDARSDQFSFCVALWSSLYHQAPFAGESLIELANAVCAGELREPPTRTDVPAFVRDALARGLATDPAERHPSMDALLVALTRDLVAARPARWRPIAAVVAAAALTAGGFWLATRERDPTPEELEQIARIAAEARRASADAHWVYPPPTDPKDTSILRVVALERLDGPPEKAARLESNLLRHEFAELLVTLGDRYWENDSGRPFARDYYSQALVFEPENARARERGLYTPGQLAELIEKAERAGFTGADLAAAELLAILADDDPARRDARLRAFLAEHGSAVQQQMIAGLIGLHVIAPPDRAEEPDPKPEPEPEPEPEPPVVAVAPPPPEPATPTPTPRPRTPKPDARPDPKPDTKAAAPEPEEQIAQAAQDRARSDELTKQGEAARRRGDLDGAELLFNQALAAYSRSGAALMGLSDVEFDRGHFEQAVVYAERAVKAEAKRAEFRIRLGDAYFKVLRYPDAKTQYEKAAELGHARAAARLDKVKEKIGE